MISVGTSGYSYDDWKGIYYAKALKKPDFLNYYSQHFSTVEINSTYYSIPEPFLFEALLKKVPESFDFVTKVNYTGYFNCVKAVVPVMKAQNKCKPENYGDIIQINSKSGLEGSKKNFAYAGSKFGGIGLTQSFAMELMPDRIKVNAICPGNFFEGPLWSDPEKGLFVQYLDAGKVPGAKSIDDVKRHYESMVPAGRGCRIGDVVKAIKYVVDQEYETCQAIPVTGGQVMLG